MKLSLIVKHKDHIYLLNKSISGVNVLNVLKSGMEFFGLTSFGASDPIKFLMRPDYKEPEHPPNIIKKIKTGNYKGSIAPLVRDLDAESGIFDGYSYRSYHRLITSREKGFYKDIGPKDMYTGSITGSMDYGWFINDPALKDKTWYKKDVFFPIPGSETTRILNFILLNDKTFVP